MNPTVIHSQRCFCLFHFAICYCFRRLNNRIEFKNLHRLTQITQTADKSLPIELRGSEGEAANCNECCSETGRIKWNLLNSIPRNKLGQNKKACRNSSSRKTTCKHTTKSTSRREEGKKRPNSYIQFYGRTFDVGYKHASPSPKIQHIPRIPFALLYFIS